MSSCDSIYIVYGQRVILEDSKYFALHIFSNEGNIDIELIIKAYESEVNTWNEHALEGRIGPFESLESLQKFSFNLCQRLNAKKIILLSKDSYNEAVENCSNVDQLCDEFNKLGDVLENVASDSPKGIFERIFH
jgi:hypothetical protein